MKSDRELDDILAEIGREHRAIGAPEGLESSLSAAAARQKHTVPIRVSPFTWAGAAAVTALAAVAIVGLIWQTSRNHQPHSQQAQSASTPHVGPEAVVLPAPVTATQSNLRRAPKAGTRRVPLRDASTQPAAQHATWTVDEFVPLPVSEGLPPAAELSVVRVKVRGSDLQQYGLQAPADAVAQTMLAEFVVGEDGLPRAIRIVR